MAQRPPRASGKTGFRPAAAIAALCLTGTALSACHAASAPDAVATRDGQHDSGQQDKDHAMTVPPVVDTKLDNPADAGAQALRSQVEAALDASLRISGEHWMLSRNDLGWNAVSKFVASKRSPDGMPPKAVWSDAGPRTIDIYPADGDRPAFAVAMDPARRADGTWLIGYFTLAPR